MPDLYELEQRGTRRAFLVAGLALIPALGAFRALQGLTVRSTPPITGDDVSIELFSAAGKSEGVVKLPMVVKTEAEWKQQLSPIAFWVTRQEGTERAFTGPYWDNHKDGLYRCICCDTALYDSKTKYESGTGWPSFWQPISALNVVKSSDMSLGMQRDAISCRRCNAHLGHVFDDGPKPTGLRYCMNGVAMKFVPRA